MKIYAVVSGDGRVKQNRDGRLAVFRLKSTAQGQARDAGDCVVEAEIDLTREPVFIRGVKL